jgi:uncharacterized protein (TIGR03435 family)
MHRIAAGLVAAGVLVLTVRPGAQEAFDAASIKRSDPGSGAAVVPAMFLPGGRWSAQRSTLAMILSSAYELPSNRIVGMPRWASTERFDIVAVAVPGTLPAQLRAMAQQLLVERFGLRAHIEQQVAELHALVRANAAGALGAGLRGAAGGCDPPEASPEAGAAGAYPCPGRISKIDGGAFRYELRNRPLGDFLILSGARSEVGDGTPIVDRTGLTGRFDIDLEFVPQSAIVDRTAQWTGAPLAVAVVEQLGLRFEKRTEPVDLLVIERVTMPTEN